MTENSKKIDKLLRLAKEVDESTFQRKSQYQSFKSKKGITPSEIQRFIDGLEILNFHEENVFWLKRALAFFSRDDLQGRYAIFMGLTRCYSCLQDYEMVLDSGKKALETQDQILQDTRLLQDNGLTRKDFAKMEEKILKSMMASSDILKRPQETMMYSKKILKLYIMVFKKAPSELLSCYSFYIKCQIENKCFSEALKTFEKMKIYSLNSTKSQDVESVLKEKLNDYMSQLNVLKQLNPKEAGDFCRAQLPSLRKAEFRVAELCEQKSIVFAELSNRSLSEDWMQVATYYFRNYQMQLNEMIVRNEDTPEYNPEILEELEDVNSKIIETHIRLASMSDTQKRMEWFAQLTFSLVRQPKSAAYYIGRAKKEYSLEQEDVMPFLEFFIDYCHREETDINIRSRRNARYRTSIEKDQKPMLVYKNSLVVMNHFTKHLSN